MAQHTSQQAEGAAAVAVAVATTPGASTQAASQQASSRKVMRSGQRAGQQAASLQPEQEVGAGFAASFEQPQQQGQQQQGQQQQGQQQQGDLAVVSRATSPQQQAQQAMPRVAASPADLDKLLANASFWRNVTSWIGALPASPDVTLMSKLAAKLAAAPAARRAVYLRSSEKSLRRSEKAGKTAWEDALPNATAGGAQAKETAAERETAADWEVFKNIVKHDAQAFKPAKPGEAQPSLSDRLNKVAWEQSLLERAADGQPPPQMGALASASQQTKAQQQQSEWTLLKKMVGDHEGEHEGEGSKQGAPGASEFELLKRIISHSAEGNGPASRNPVLKQLKEMQAQQQQAAQVQAQVQAVRDRSDAAPGLAREPASAAPGAANQAPGSTVPLGTMQHPSTATAVDSASPADHSGDHARWSPPAAGEHSAEWKEAVRKLDIKALPQQVRPAPLP